MSALLECLLGYLVVLLIPGPNMLLVASIAGLRGLGAAVPLCLGLALGATTLCLLLLGASQVLAGGGWWHQTPRLLGAALLGLLALRLLRAPQPGTSQAGTPQPGTPQPGKPQAGTPRLGHATGLGAGFCTALLNPLTTAYVTAALVGPLAPGTPGREVLPVAVGLMCLGTMMAVALLLAGPAARRLALAWQQPIRWGAAVAMALMAAGMLRPLWQGPSVLTVSGAEATPRPAQAAAPAAPPAAP